MADGMEISELEAAGLITIVARGRQTSISSVHFYGEEGPHDPDALIATPGPIDVARHSDILDLAAASKASLVIVSRTADPDTVARYRETGVGLATLGSHADWSQLAWFVRSMLNRAARDQSLEIPLHQGLFAIADAVAAMLDAPVTIEDVHSRVVAYSATADGADATRTSTIMTRAVPTTVLRRLRATGVLRRLTEDDRPFLVPSVEPGFLPRLVIPLRLGNQAVGSIWAIWEGDLDLQLEAQLVATGAAAALNLVHLNASLDSADQYSLEAIRTALRDGTAQAPQLLRLPFRAMRVVALQRLSDSAPVDDLVLWRTFFRKKSWPDPILADVDGHLFAIAPEHSGPGGWPWLRDLAVTGIPGRMAASRSRAHSSELPMARQEATDALMAADVLDKQLLDYESDWDVIVLTKASNAVQTIEHAQLRSLSADDRNTLCTWLECSGDIRDAASRLHVHPNTVRHRLKKLDQLVGGVLRTHNQRLAALLLLRSWDHATSAGHR